MVEYMKNLSELIDGKFVIAVIGMTIIVIGMIVILSLIVISFQQRKEAVAVSLPDINANGRIDDEPAFTENNELTIELIVDNEDVVKNSKIDDNDEEHFLTALSYEAKQCFSEENQVKLDMPEVGEIDYEKIKEEKKQERENTFINHFKEIAEDDKEEGFDPHKLNGELQG